VKATESLKMSKLKTAASKFFTKKKKAPKFVLDFSNPDVISAFGQASAVPKVIISEDYRKEIAIWMEKQGKL
jgi:hypothetical protein